MWMCDRCQEINDDTLTACPKCGWANQSSVPLPSTDSFDDNRASGQAQPAEIIPPLGNPPGMWSDMGMAITKSMVVTLCLGVLVIVELAPSLINGPISLVVSIPSLLLLAPVTVAAWKIAHLKSHGLQTMGTVVARRDTPGAWKTPPRAWATVQYVIDGRAYQIKDTYGGHIDNYPQVGAHVPVLYDRGMPRLALPLVPTAPKWVTLANMAIFGLFLLGVAWCMHYAPGP